MKTGTANEYRYCANCTQKNPACPKKTHKEDRGILAIWNCPAFEPKNKKP